MLASAFGKTGRASMSTVIKNGTIVTHDLTYKADVLIEDGKIAEIGKNLKGDEDAGRHRVLCDARRDRPAYASGNAVHGHLFGG
jgi:urease alpha subunit